MADQAVGGDGGEGGGRGAGPDGGPGAGPDGGPDGGLGGVEARRLEWQAALDAGRSARERNACGQFATPPGLARDIVRYALDLHGPGPVRFLEPSCGSGAFFSALLEEAGGRVASAVGVEADPRFAEAAAALWGGRGLRVVRGDFTDAAVSGGVSASLLVANPPYVRHHHLTAERKRALGRAALEVAGVRPSGLSGLYLYFVLLGHRPLAPGAVAAWLLPGEFLDVNYGAALRRYLTERVRLLRVHRYDAAAVQFDDALVSSAVVAFRNEPPEPGAVAEFTAGGPLGAPRAVRRVPVSELRPAEKWSGLAAGGGRAPRPGGGPAPVLADFFTVRRGLATGANAFFVLERERARRLGIGDAFLRPVLPGPRRLAGPVVEADAAGWPLLERPLALIDCRRPIEEVRRVDPALAGYLEAADERTRTGYLASRRTPWYRQESREPAPLLLSYMGRGRDGGHPLRFVLNRSRAVATNTYLMLYPTPLLDRYLAREPDGMRRVHQALGSLPADALRAGGRVYGGGLHKMEPRELAALPADVLVALAPDLLTPGHRASDPRAPGLLAPDPLAPGLRGPDSCDPARLGSAAMPGVPPAAPPAGPPVGAVGTG